MKTTTLTLLGAAGLAVLLLGGCGDDDSCPAPAPGTQTLYLTDALEVGIDHVPYFCAEETNETQPLEFTTPTGAFGYRPGETCEFNLFGFDGNETIRFTDEAVQPVSGIAYVCDNNKTGGRTEGATDEKGEFEYKPDAVCRFRF